MSSVDLLVRRLLGDVAPDVDFATVPDDEDVREAADLDSVDFLNFVEAIHAETGVDVPERDYPEIRTIDGCRRYLEHRLRS
jgi:acyl carrier protein